jgi:hypothetical protein
MKRRAAATPCAAAICQAGEVATAEVDHLAGSNKLLHRLPDLLPRRASVDVVHLVQVDVVGPQSTQAVLAGLADVVRREATIVGSGAHRLVQLGGEHDLVAATAGLGEPAAEVLLGDPVTLLHVGRLRAAVDVGGVDEVDAGLYGGVQHGEAVRLAGLHAEVHGAQPDPADLQTGTAQIVVLHAVLLHDGPCGHARLASVRPNHDPRAGGSFCREG